MPDQESFCDKRSGTDFPLSLLKPYPVKYDMPPVFEKSTGSPAAHTTLSLLTLLLVCLALGVVLLF
jgi:hypothetical protein